MKLTYQGTHGDKTCLAAIQIPPFAHSGDHVEPFAAVLWLCIVYKLSCSSSLFPGGHLLLWNDGSASAVAKPSTLKFQNEVFEHWYCRRSTGFRGSDGVI